MDTKIHTLGALCGNTDQLVCYSLTLRKRARLRLGLRRSHENTLPSHPPRTRQWNLLLRGYELAALADRSEEAVAYRPFSREAGHYLARALQIIAFHEQFHESLTFETVNIAE
jgi:hypothetical protein